MGLFKFHAGWWVFSSTLISAGIMPKDVNLVGKKKTYQFVSKNMLVLTGLLTSPFYFSSVTISYQNKDIIFRQ